MENHKKSNNISSSSFACGFIYPQTHLEFPDTYAAGGRQAVRLRCISHRRVYGALKRPSGGLYDGPDFQGYPEESNSQRGRKIMSPWIVGWERNDAPPASIKQGQIWQEEPFGEVKSSGILAIVSRPQFGIDLKGRRSISFFFKQLEEMSILTAALATVPTVAHWRIQNNRKSTIEQNDSSG